MPETPGRLFVVTCGGCGRSLVTVDRVRDPEIGALVDHLRACSASKRLADRPMLGAVMAGVRVTTLKVRQA